jgi:hypothetical protein
MIQQQQQPPPVFCRHVGLHTATLYNDGWAAAPCHTGATPGPVRPPNITPALKESHSRHTLRQCHTTNRLSLQLRSLLNVATCCAQPPVALLRQGMLLLHAVLQCHCGRQQGCSTASAAGAARTTGGTHRKRSLSQVLSCSQRLHTCSHHSHTGAATPAAYSRDAAASTTAVSRGRPPPTSLLLRPCPQPCVPPSMAACWHIPVLRCAGDAA